MKKGIYISSAVALIILTLIYLVITVPVKDSRYSKENPEFYFRTQDRMIQRKEGDSWKDFEIKGVNIGSSYPGHFPGDNEIDEETYLRWMEMIGDMNANTIRVYELHPPAFYEALYRYNLNHDDKLYLIQTIDFPEMIMYEEGELFDSKTEEELIEQSCREIAALHGDRIMFNKKDASMSFYTRDISEYVLGYIIGIEWDEIYVRYISQVHKDVGSHRGAYLHSTEGASVFETFLAKWADKIIEYENETYYMQHLYSFGNWAVTDPFINNVQPSGKEGTEVMIDVENVSCTDQVKTGIFASYNVYPYYPLFLQYGPYTKYVDADGNVNPYRKYMMELVEHHSYPVVISEFGVPSSRSVAHGDLWRDFSHGGLNEKEQAEAAAALYKDIKEAGCAGAMVFSWQDEWYKKTWNEMLLSDPEGRKNWSNVQSAEQTFGLLSFDPGKEQAAGYPDGDTSEWRKEDLVLDHGYTKVSIRQDEEYLYILAEGLDEEKENNLINIALDITPESGKDTIQGIASDREMDFVIQIGREESALYVDNEYDVFSYSVFSVNNDDSTIFALRKLDEITEKDVEKLENDPEFSIVARADNTTYGMFSVSSKVNEVGRMKHGNGNPKSEDFDSNADYFVGEDFVEIRIPWQLLNFTDPSSNKIIGDLKEHNYAVTDKRIRKIYVAPYYDGQKTEIVSGVYRLKKWKEPEFHERLKDSYYKLQESYGED